ncbi:MAG: lipid biosynthesis B12-binding/radical SAM protein [Bacteroidota bacterium]
MSQKTRKLLLISANRFATPYPVYPIGLSYIQSYLSARLDFLEIRIVDMNLCSTEELVAYLLEYQPDYTGISFRNVDDVDSMNRNFFITGYKEVVEVVKKTVTTRLIIGGAAFSIFPKELYRFFDVEFGIYGEGEDSMYQLILALENNMTPENIEGLVFRKGEEVIQNDRKNFSKNLDLSFSKDLTDFYWEKSGMMNVQTKRGCPYHCIYCTYPIIEGRKVRMLNADKIVETLTDVYHNKKINYVFFTDSVFNLNKKFNQELAEKIIQSGIKIKWGAYFSPHDLDVETLELYFRAGLTHVEFGTESLSDHTLEKYGKHFKFQDVLEVSENCNKVGIYYSHFLILAGYGETEDTINEGFENSKRIENTVFFPYIGMRIYPGTELHRLAIEDKSLSPDDELIEPAYYLADGIDYSTLRSRAEMTGRRWVFPDEDVVTFMNRMRERKRKGSLWHHLKR